MKKQTLPLGPEPAGQKGASKEPHGDLKSQRFSMETTSQGGSVDFNGGDFNHTFLQMSDITFVCLFFW